MINGLLIKLLLLSLIWTDVIAVKSLFNTLHEACKYISWINYLRNLVRIVCYCTIVCDDESKSSAIYCSKHLFYLAIGVT